MRPRRWGMVVAAAVVSIGLTGCGDGKGFVLPAPATTTTTIPLTTRLTTTTTIGLDKLAWKDRASAPVARQEVGSAVLDGKVWVVGGLTSAGAVATVETYDPAADKWAPGPDLPVAVHHPAVVAYRNEVVVMGGFLAGSGDLYARPTDRVFALRNGAWAELPKLRRPRGAAAAAVAADRIVLVGGRDASQMIALTEAWDGNQWQDRARIPTPRDHLAADSDGQLVYAVGGRFLSPARTTGVLERYDPVRDAWDPLASMPTERGGLGAALFAGRLIAAGGEDPTGVYEEVEAYDVHSDTWKALAKMPAGRHGLALNTVGTAVYALDGGEAYGVAPSKVAQALQ